MGMDVVVVGEPDGQRAEHGLGIGALADVDVVAFERADERLGDAVALRGFKQRGLRRQAEVAGEASGLARDVGAAVIAQPLDRLRQAVKRTQRTVLDEVYTQAGLNEHTIADQLAGWLEFYNTSRHYYALGGPARAVRLMTLRAINPNEGTRRSVCQLAGSASKRTVLVAMPARAGGAIGVSPA